MFHFELLNPREIPWDGLDAFDDRVVFQTRKWLDFIAESQKAKPVVAKSRDGNTVAGYFSGLVVRVRPSHTRQLVSGLDHSVYRV